MIDWHDAEVDRLLLLSEGEAEVAFNELYTFAPGPSGPELKVRPGRLLLRGVTGLALHGQLEAGGYVSYAVTLGPAGQPVSTDALLAGAELRRLELHFTNGARLELDLERATLQLE